MTRGQLWRIVWWATLALAAPVLAFTVGVSGLAAGPVFVVVVIRVRSAQINDPPHPSPLPPIRGRGNIEGGSSKSMKES
jgi:hypothetical protein